MSWALTLKVVGLALLLTAWGADQFWRSASIDKLKKIEFMTINSSIIDNNAELQFLKYITQNRTDPKLLTLSYRNLLQGIATTSSLLRADSVRGADEIFQRSLALLNFVQKAYESGSSVEPKDLGGRKIKSEIVQLESGLQEITKGWLNGMRSMHKNSRRVFLIIYILGSLALIGSEFFK